MERDKEVSACTGHFTASMTRPTTFVRFLTRVKSGAWHRCIFQSDIPKVKAYDGELPSGQTGIEFETEVKPDSGHVPGKPTWSVKPKRAGVVHDGDCAKIKVRVLRQTVID